MFTNAVLQVNITTDPPTPPYPAATWIRFKCDVQTQFPVSYNWTGYCTSQGSNQVAFRHTNYNVSGIFTLGVRSTPTSCIDTIVCSAVDSMGNSGEATWQIDNVTGENNSAKFAVSFSTTLIIFLRYSQHLFRVNSGTINTVCTISELLG